MNQEQKFLAIIICLLLSVTNIAPVIHRFLSIFIKRLLKKILSFHLFRKKDEIILGPIRISDRDRIRHTHIVGATGSGKTLLMESLIYEDLKNGRGALIIDPKGDRELYERIKEFCEKIGRISDLHLVSAQYKEESVRWNPCRLGSASEIQSKFLNAWVFSESFYEKACESALLEAINNVLKEKEYFHLPDLVSYIKKNTTKSKNIEALFLDFNNLIESEWKEILCASPPKLTKKEINFLDITRKNEIIFLDLPTEGKSVQSSKIGRLFLQEIILISGLRKIFPSLRSQTPFPIYIDEFDAFVTESFSSFQNKARSSNFMIHLAHQTLSDLKVISDSFMGKIMGNTNVRFVFRQDDPDDAEKWANFFGTKDTLKTTFRTKEGDSTGEASNRISKEFRIHPDTIKELAIGECIFSVKSSETLSQIRVPLPKPKRYFKNLPIARKESNYTPPPQEKIDPNMLKKECS